MPNRDHSTDWVDPASEQIIFIDEPYDSLRNEAERAAWADTTGWLVAKTGWPGMYRPYCCDLYVATDGGTNYDLSALVKKINAMPAPLVDDNWPGESSLSWDTFLSPMAKNKQDARRARSRGTIYRFASAATVPYDFRSSMRRPAGKMEPNEHIEAGRIIKAVLRSDHRPYGAYRHMSSLRSTLEDWMILEREHGSPKDPEFIDVYYGSANDNSAYLEKAKSRTGIVAMLQHLKQKLQVAYPDCAPLRRQLYRIDRSLALIDKSISAKE